MNESENKNSMPNNVLHGPWKTKKVKIPEDSIFELQQERAFIEDLSERVIMQMIYALGENGVNIDTKDFFQNIAFIIECLKSALYKEHGWPHPLTSIIENISKVTEETFDDHETIKLRLDINKIIALVEKLNLNNDETDDGPKLA